MSNEYKNIDDLFRNKFENFEPKPPEHVWKNIKTQISDNRGAAGKNGLSNGSLSIISILLISVGLLSSFLLINNQINQPSQELIIADAQSDADYTIATNSKDSQELLTGDEDTYTVRGIENHSGQSRIEGDKKKDGKKNKKGRKKSKKRGATSPEIKPEVTSDVLPEKIGKTSLLAKPEVIGLNDLKARTIVVAPVNNDKSGSKIYNRKENLLTETFEPSQGKHTANSNLKGEWNLGLYFTPEMIRYPSDNNLNNYRYGLDVLATWKKNNLLVQSGIGISHVKDQGDFEVNYNKYVGSYEDVYDVTFDSIGNEMVPTFHTETVNVFDSINHTSYMHTKRSYTYLQVPLLFGYTEEFRRFGWFVKTGPAMLFLINKNVPEVSPTNDPYRLLTVNSDVPDRISTQWSYLFTAGINYKAGNNIHMSVEPLFRYHINPAYKRNSLSTKHPYSFGLRLGLLYNF